VRNNIASRPAHERPRGLRRVIRKKDLRDFVGLGPTQLDELIKKKEFPPGHPISDSGRARIWFEDELIEWQEKRGAAA
jgi:predicted DNA-binding transcriptional regulator AlpA